MSLTNNIADHLQTILNWLLYVLVYKYDSYVYIIYISDDHANTVVYVKL